MTFDDYEKKYEALYNEFAGVVKFVLEKALAETNESPRHQSIQCRGKAAAHLKPKLQDRGTLDSQSIESEIKDLAGARLIFYTNTDVDRFLSSRLIPNNFDVQWDETRIHHPIEENAQRRYQAIHYTVYLNQARTSLPEYAKFKGMRCEIQIQTILNHAWAETSHDILYKAPGSKGFGNKAMQSIEKRLMRIMDDYLLPAGYEFQKVQHDFQRLMKGKALFDRGAIETLEHSTNNNDRHEILGTLKEYVLPHYDDIQGIYPELRRALVKAIDDARSSEVQPIHTPFGDLPGKTPQDVTAVVIDILDTLRYIDIEGTFQVLGDVYKAEQDSTQRKHILETTVRLAEHNLQAWKQVGPGVQLVLARAIDRLTLARRADLRPILLAVWQQFLSSEISGTTSSADTVTFSRCAVPASKELKKIRESAINGLIEFLDQASTEAEKSEAISSLWEATRLPLPTHYSNELCALVLSDTKRIVELLTNRTVGLSYQLLEHIERNLLYDYRRARGISTDEQDRFGCKELANSLAGVVVEFRDLVNADSQFVQYKALVGFESVFPHHWEDDKFDFNRDEQYRQQRIEEFVELITADNQDEWYSLMERCAATKSSDSATFFSFGAFITRLAKDKPDIAAGFLERANDDLLVFLPAFLNGLFDSGARDIYLRTIENQLAKGTHLAAIARHWSSCKSNSASIASALLDNAISSGDDIAVIQCVALAIKKHESEHQPPVEEFFVRAIEYLTTKKDYRWTYKVWFMPERSAFFTKLSADHIELVLENLLLAPRVDTQVEFVLSSIAEKHTDAVWNFLGRRLNDKREQEEQARYDAIPYQFQQLGKQLSTNAQSATRIVRSWYHADEELFRFRGGRLLSIVFPDFSQPFAHALSELVAEGSDDDIGFALSILHNYSGEPATHALVKQLVNRLADDDPMFPEVESSLEEVGIVYGEFGSVEAFRRKRTEITSWLADDRARVKAFAERFIRKLELRIASEQRTAEQWKELRQRDFDADVVEPE